MEMLVIEVLICVAVGEKSVPKRPVKSAVSCSRPACAAAYACV